MQKVILCVCFFVKMFCYSAFGEEPDTLILLNEATVSARKIGDFGAGHHSSTIDSTTISRFSASDLGSLLRWHSGVPIRSFGPGSLATTNLRGGTAAQTAVLWNGFSLHSPMNGQTDLSSLPAFFADEIHLQKGAGSAIWGSGAMGGAIFLNNRPNAARGFSGQVGLNAGNSDDFSQSVRLGYGSRNFASTLRFFNREAQNHYRFANELITGAPIEKQQNAGFGLTALLHETWLRLGRGHQIDLRWWWQENQRHIPPSLDFAQFLSEQSDRILRVSAQYQVNLHEVTFFLRGARFREELYYSDNFGFSSESSFVFHAGEAEARWEPGPVFTLNSGILFQDNKALATDYAGEKQRTSWSIYTSARWAPMPGKLDFVVSGRQELVSGMEIPFTPSLGFSFTFLPNWKVKANTGYSFRLPSMNDMYWNPGGNPELLPEQGWNSDFRVEFDSKDNEMQSDFVPFEYLSAGVYDRSIRNWIIWLPQGDSWLWMPENRAQVNSFGFESIMSGFWQTGTIKAQWTFRFDHTIARNAKETRPNDPSLNKQLIYVPLNRAMVNLALTYRQLGIIYDHEFTGKRFNSSDNSTWLPSFQTGNLAIQWNSDILSYKVGLNLTVENIWNTRFQILSNRPMPLRIIRAGIRIGFAGSR